MASLPRASPRGIGSVVSIGPQETLSMSSPGIQTTSLVRVLVLPTEPDVRLRDVPAEVQGDGVLWYRNGNVD